MGLFEVLVPWIGSLLMWEETVDAECMKGLMPVRYLLAHPENVVGIIVCMLSGVGMWAFQQWYRRTKGRLEAGQPFKKMPAK
jgi:hypothetical protein